MKRLGGRSLFCGMLVGVGLLWGACALLDWGGQRKALYQEGRELLSDFWMPSDCAHGGYVRTDGIASGGWIMPEDLARGGPISGTWKPGAVFRVGWMDCVYPAFALLPFRVMPSTWTAGWCWTVGAGLIFLLALVLCARGRLWPLAFACSYPFLFNFERGNPVWLSAAAVAVFLVWWDDETRWKRVVAAVCLAVAGAMKLAPAILGLLYLREGFSPIGRRHVRMAFLAGVLTVVFLVVPWVWMPDGFAGVGAFLANAKHHSEYVLRASDFGFVQIWRSVRMAFGVQVQEPWPGMVIAARLSQFCGFVVLLVGVRRRDYLLLVGGMLLAAGNMYFYAALYLLPVFVIEEFAESRPPGEARTPPLQARSCLSCVIRLALWFALCCPIQLIVLGRPANGVICNCALMSLLVLAVVRRMRPEPRTAA